jgi:hypothetical protein
LTFKLPSINGISLVYSPPAQKDQEIPRYTVDIPPPQAVYLGTSWCSCYAGMLPFFVCAVYFGV